MSWSSWLGWLWLRVWPPPPSPPFLSGLSDDEVEAIGYALADPLAPHLAVALSSCSRGLHRALEGPRTQLRERFEEARELCSFLNTRWSPARWGSRI